MKKFALPFLYVFSIVLAVGIGMSQVGKEDKLKGGGGTNSIEIPTCATVIDKGQCTSTATKLGAFTGKYVAKEGQTTYCTGIPACVPESHGNVMYNAD